MADRVILNIEVAVVRDDGRYLIIVRGPGEEHAAGMLAFPGGGFDFDIRHDALEDTAMREVQEEVGLVVSDLHYVHSYTFTAGSEDVVDIVFLARYAGGEPTITDPEEVSEIRWMTVEEIIPASPEWMRPSLERVEAVRRARFAP